MNKLIYIALILLSAKAGANAQIAQNGTYKLEQAIVSSGGGTSADASNNLYSLTGAIGQAVAGTTSTNAP